MRQKPVPKIARDMQLEEYGDCTFRLLNVVNPCPTSNGPCTPCELDMRVNAMGYDHPYTVQVKRFLATHKWAALVRETGTRHLIQHGHYALQRNPNRREHPEGGVWQYWQWENGRWVLRNCSDTVLRVHRIFILVCVRELPTPTKIQRPKTRIVRSLAA